MKLRILAIGKPKLRFAKLGCEEYLSRLNPHPGAQVDYLKGSTPAQESQLLAERSQGSYRIVMDESGRQVTSRELADRISTLEIERTKDVCFLIGGASGHTTELKRSADWCWSLGKLTLQHELALIVLLEQIYRAYAIKANSPYHRDSL